MGSSPIRVAIFRTYTPRGFSSFGRAPPCQGGGGGFEPRNPLQDKHFDNSRCFFYFPWGSNKFEIHSSRIVASHHLRKSAVRLARCFVSHRLRKQQLVIFASLTRNPLQDKHFDDSRCFFIFHRARTSSRSIRVA